MGIYDYLKEINPVKTPKEQPKSGIYRYLGELTEGQEDTTNYKQQIQNAERRITAAGGEVPPPEDKPGMFERVLDFLDKGNQLKNRAVLGMLGAEHIPDRAQGSDVMRHLGIGGDNQYRDEIGGFVFDLLTDPTNFLTLGTGGVAAQAAKGAVKGTKASKALKIGASIPFTKFEASVSLPGSSKLLDVAGKAGKSLLDFTKGALENKAPEILEIGRGTRNLVGRAFNYGYGVAKPVVNSTRRFMDLTRMDTKDIVDDVVDLTKNWPKVDDLTIIKHLEEGTIDQLDDTLRPVAENVRKFFDDAWTEANQRGIINEFRDNYIPHIFKGNAKAVKEALEQIQRRGVRMKTTTGFSQERTVLEDLYDIMSDPKLRAKFKPETSLPKIMAIYKMSLKKAMRNRDMLEELVNLGDDIIVKTGNLTEKHRNWVQSPIIQLKDYYVSPEVARHLKDVMEPFFNNDTMDKIMRHYDEVLGWWKGWATIPNIGFHIRNELGNIFNNYLGGVRTVQPYKIASEIMSGGKGVVNIQGRNIPYQTLRQMAREHGVSEVGMFGADISEAVTREMSRLTGAGKYNPLSTQNFFFQGLEKFGRGLEDHSRLAHFVDKLMKGYTPQEAALSVKKYLFDYTLLSPMEKNVFKRFVPFYSWTRNNLPLQLSELVKQPGVAAKMSKFQNFAEAMSEEATGSKIDKDVIPEYVRRMYSLRLPFQYEGKDVITGVDIPMRDFNTLDPQEWFSMLTPLISVPFEQAFNKNLFFDREIEEYPGQKIRAPGYIQGLWKFAEALGDDDPNRNLWLSIFKGLGVTWGPGEDGRYEAKIPPRVAHVLNQLVFFKNIGKMADFATGDIRDPFAVSSTLTGVSAVSIDKAKSERTADYLRSQQLQNVIRALKDQGMNINTVRELDKAPQRSGIYRYLDELTGGTP